MKVQETYPATVINNEDPEKFGRIKVACAALLGDEEQALPLWIPMVPSWGWFTIPDVGEVVEIEITTGSADDEVRGQASLHGMDIKYRTHRHFGNESGPQPTPIAADFTSKNYGKRRGFATPRGHIFLFDDTPGDERVSITCASGPESTPKFSFIGMDKDGSVIVSNANGATLSLDAKAKQVMLIDEFSNAVTLAESGISAVSKFGNSVALNDSGVMVLGDAVTISCKNASIDAGEITLAGDAEAAILGTTFLEMFAAHIHPTGLGPSGPALPGASGSSAPFLLALSQKVKLG